MTALVSLFVILFLTWLLGRTLLDRGWPPARRILKVASWYALGFIALVGGAAGLGFLVGHFSR